MERILKDSKFQQQLIDIAKKTGDNQIKVYQEAEGYLKELYASQQPFANLAAVEMSQYILSRGYNKNIDVNPLELKQLTKLMRSHPVAFVMTHKTYIDMLVLAVVLARHGLPLPYTFAGLNMDMMGLGQLGRQSGFIFIRRSFKDNLVYKATLRHFIASLVDEQAHFMWAIEGTRSRTGKLVWPQMGILKYIMEAEQDSTQDVQYVPVSIVYDLIPDVKEMTTEGRGKAKKQESLAWFMDYVRKMGDNFGRISLRFGAPVAVSGKHTTPIPNKEEAVILNQKYHIPRFAFELVHRINQITPVTTTSLICTSLLSKYALTKRAIESDIAEFMRLIENHKPDALVDRGKPVGESVRVALNLLLRSKILKQQGEGLEAKYVIDTDYYLPANYYSNMSVHHLYRRAFIELAFLEVIKKPKKDRLLAFWTTMMELRDLFKFEFFYSNKATFCDEVEKDLAFLHSSWESLLTGSDEDIEALLEEQKVIVAPAILYNYVEAYEVVAHTLQTWNAQQAFDEKIFIQTCLAHGEEMRWQGRIQRIETVSKPFLLNGIRLVKNKDLIPSPKDRKAKALQQFLRELRGVNKNIKKLQKNTLNKRVENFPLVPIERDIVPGSTTDGITREIIEGESGPHIGAFFDLDRTLIKGFSAKEFFQARILSGKMTPKEVVAQLAGLMMYASGDGNFAALAAMGAKGVKGVKEKVFLDVGEEVYHKHLADAIYPEARAMVSAHLAKGHTVAIVSAATPYQVVPVARDVGIEHVRCTRMEVENGAFTGAIVEPACWGEGKAHAGKELAKEFNLDLTKSFFYTDSAEDLPLLEIVGHPRPINPDAKLSSLAFKNEWPIYRFSDDEPSKLEGMVRTGLAAGSLIPAAMLGMASGATSLSWKDGINTMMASVGDLVTTMAGVSLAVRGEEHLWSSRPAVFILNHQSSTDMFIAAKLIRKDAAGIAKKELQKFPILGQLLQAGGAIFIDRKDRAKAIEAMKPAVDALKSGTSIIIFPEGTRSYDYQLAPFKKGAFHLAMQAGVPVIPIILKNAHDAMPRGTALFKPTVVEVAILPPIPTHDWTLENLTERVAEVRGLFLKELGQLDAL